MGARGGSSVIWGLIVALVYLGLGALAGWQNLQNGKRNERQNR